MLVNTFSRLMTVCLLLILAPMSVMAKTYQHSLGTIEINQVPKRVVVLGYGSLDFIDELGITPVGLPKSLVPKTLEKYKADNFVNTGGTKEVNYETLFNLKPDLIIAEGRMIQLYPELNKIAPTYMFVVDNNDYWKSTKAHWLALGEIFNKQDKVKSMIAEIESKTALVAAQTQAKPTRVMTVLNSGNNLSVFSYNSRFSFVYQEAGFLPIDAKKDSDTKSRHGNLISFEYIAAAKPDALFVLDREQAIGESSGKAKALFNNELVNSTPAAKNKKIVFMDPSAWYLMAGGYQSTLVMIKDLNLLISQ